MKTILWLGAALGLIGLEGCRAVPTEADDPAAYELPQETDIGVVSEATNFTMESTTVWVYIQEKYDFNGDGAVSPEEYKRSHDAFVRLDRNRDGVVTADDFQRAGRMATMVTRMTLIRYFQTDSNPRDLHLAELEARFDAHDKDGDGEFSREEYGKAITSVLPGGPGGPRPMPAGMNVYATMLEITDEDGNGSLSKAELVAFFRLHDNGSGVWALRDRQRRPRSSRPDGAASGTTAPDFTLRDPKGRSPVTLSAHQGKKPVALIFGSYT